MPWKSISETPNIYNNINEHKKAAQKREKETTNSEFSNGE